MAYSFYRTITFDPTKIPSTLTNFPALVSLTNASLKTTANGGKVENSSGFDIIFSSTNDLSGVDKIPFEIEKYIATTGEIIMWVKVASLDGTVDTVIYMLYGNVAISTSQEDVANVWDANYKGVYHLKDTAGSPDLNDSTGNNKDLAPVSASGQAVIAAQIGDGIDIDGDYFSTANTFGNVVFPLSIQFWIRADAADTFAGIVGHVDDGSAAGSGIQTYLTANGANVRPDYTLGGVVAYDFTTLTFAINTWAFVVFRLNAAGTTCKVYRGVSGTLSTESQTVLAAFVGTADTLSMGATTAAPLADFNGRLDEIRYSNLDRSDDWWTTEYNNQFDPSTFFAVGNEVTSVLTITASDAFSLSDTHIEEVGILISFSDALSITDDETVEGPDPAIVQSDTLSLSDAVLAIAALLMEFNDTLSLSDNALLLNTLGLGFSDTISLGDAVSINASGGTEISDVLLLTDQLNLLLGLFLQISDTLTLSDSAQVAIIQEIGVSDTLVLVDSIIVALSNTIISLTFSDTLVLSDAASLALHDANVPIIDNLPYYRRYLNDVPR